MQKIELTTMPKILTLVLLLVGASSSYRSFFDGMKCSYGERGSLTATCVNATPSFFKATPYRFDHLDETLRCINCTLSIIDSGTFDISGNQIKNLDLSNSLINTIRQKAFVGGVFLETIDLSNNQIKSVYPGTFTGVKKITYVTLANNSITALSEDGFLELVNLKTLNLRQNHIQTIVTNAFIGLINMVTLDLSYNEISDVKNVFNNLTSLQVLYLHHNKIMNLSGADFNNLTALKEIDLGHNFIATIPNVEFVEMSSLRRLILSNNLIAKVMAGSFKGLDQIEDLDLSYNVLTNIPQRTLVGLHSLENLNVSYNRLTTFQTGLYSGLPQLRSLNLSHNNIEEIEITGVFSLHSLHSLDFSYNNITDLDYVGLIWRLPRISYLNLEGNVLPCDLDKEMTEYFAQDNFKFMVESSICSNIAKFKHAKTEYLQDGLRNERPAQSNATIIVIFLLICITLILVAILFYLQFRIYNDLRAGNLPKSTSQVQLVSSELQARDSDFMKDC